MGIREAIETYKIIAIVRGFEPVQCEKLAQALLAGGIRLMEITFPQESNEGMKQTAESIRRIVDATEGKILPGAGTVMTKEQVDLAKASGAQYIISPNTDVEIIRYTKEVGLISMPGAMTPSEIVAAYSMGADYVKVFPAGVLGAAYFHSLQGPLSHIPMMAVGGISEKNVNEFLEAGAKGVGVGGLLTRKELIENERYEDITRLARAYTGQITEQRDVVSNAKI